ncbi:uncharacterized protein TA07315 [Theileria annulata]|uniref:Uncharacterized protein n=1 Tax=Theileria annulata TaxID=5874 RepID=Q4UA82_THEAN|nr:uncharacterized protein TA07315 [Theileria annulata]CAI76271.1 hypothetical protein, conserved [Theileria annulata]|eukprot:XP_952895.1 hypothetical protein, conserved [Theileria annulata]
MEYIIGGTTGLLKEVNTKNRSILRLCSLEDQALDRFITTISWSGGFGYGEDEITVGYESGLVRSYSTLTAGINKEYHLDSKCVYVTVLSSHFHKFTKAIYSKNKNSTLYPNLTIPTDHKQCSKTLLSVTQNGYIYLFDTENCPQTVPNCFADPDNSDTDNTGSCKLPLTKINHPYSIAVFKYKSPLTCACTHSLMKNRLVIAGQNNPPALIDLFSEKVLWVGKYPHETLLGLQSSLDITSLSLLEELGDDIICVGTKDSFVYVYDPNSQKDPIFQFNICDQRSSALSKRALTLPEHDFNTKHRKQLDKAVNENYSSNDRAILKIATNPPFKLLNGSKNSNENDTNNINSNNSVNFEEKLFDNNLEKLFNLSNDFGIELYNYPKKDYCNVYISDNFGTVYYLQFLTNDKLIHWINNKINQNSKNSSTKSVEIMDEKEKLIIAEHLLEARKRLCTSSNNDKRVHYRRNSYNQMVCRILSCYNYHNGSVVDLKCSGDYLVTAGIDRFTKIIHVPTHKLVFQLYSNQKQSSILLRNESIMKKFSHSDFKPLTPQTDNTVDSSDEIPADSEEESDLDESDLDEDDLEDEESDLNSLE